VYMTDDPSFLVVLMADATVLVIVPLVQERQSHATCANRLTDPDRSYLREK